MDRRHERQSKLKEVGSAGQARLARACVDVAHDGLAGETAVRYLAGAGIGRLRVADESLAAAARAVDPAVTVDVVPGLAGDVDRAETFDLEDEAARAVAAGALAALRALRRALEGRAGGAPP
jgi:hypothetical protein